MIFKKMKISIITVSRNAKLSINDCINSVLMQSYINFEYIIIDGASTDGTLDIINSYKDSVSTIISEPDLGIYDALNKGILKSTGDIIGFLHADDILAHKNVLNKIALSFNDPSISAVFGDLDYVSRDDPKVIVRKWVAGEFLFKNLNKGWMPPHPTLYLRREAYTYTNGFDISYSISADYHFILGIFSRPHFKALYIPEVLVKMRLGGVSNRSLRNLLTKSKEDLRAIKYFQIGGFMTLIFKNILKINQFFK